MFKSIVIFLSLFATINLTGQSISFSLEVEQDTIKLGDYLTVTYTLSGARGEFQEPEFGSLRLVGGPNFSSQISIVNGKMDQTFTYTYIFQPDQSGRLHIPEASATVDGELFISPSADVYITENKDWNPKRSAPPLPKRRKSNRDKNVTEI